MAKMSYATERKKRIIAQRLGEDWQEQHPNESIDAIYNRVVGDSRKNLFCKIDPEVKTQLDEMADFYDVRMAELVERLVREEYNRFEERRDLFSSDLAAQFAAGH